MASLQVGSQAEANGAIAAAGQPEDGESWLFAYGSLMWRPDFDYLDAVPARLSGYHRRLCLYSYIYRGSPEMPGLVLGLDRGGSCWGIAFRIAPGAVEEVLRLVDARELLYDVYHRRLLPVQLGMGEGGVRLKAHAYVVNRQSPQYAGRLPPGRVVEFIRQGHGERGSCLDYLRNTVTHLEELGLPDRQLSTLLHKMDTA
ncbi:MAG: gamma-glutamylcyclotransferase [Alphaproteobacteria bacterium]